MKPRIGYALTLILAAACVASPSRTATGPFSLTIEAEENPVKVGSEVKVDITLRNSSNRAMSMSMGPAETDYAFEVRDSQNRIPAETELARQSKGKAHFSNDQIFTLQRGDSLPKAVLIVTKFYDLSRPGKYTIQVSRQTPKELGSGTVKSNAITLTVSP
jgi:uncharacterized protein (DUF58 family)